jgi:hypothetical protein
MERESIINNTLDLPIIEVGHVAEDSEVWACTDGEAHFRMARVSLSKRGLEFYDMRISGPNEERHRIMMEFIDALGPPTEYGQMYTKNGPVDSLSWLIKPRIRITE